MRAIAFSFIFALASVHLIGSAVAADLTGAELKELLTGKSVYLQNTATSTAGAGQSVLYYAADGTALYKTGSGRVLHGTWTIKDNTTCNVWKEQPNACSRYDKTGDTINVVNAATGEIRGKVLKIVDGNPEKIAP
ncbi:MAG: hypothetical protein WB760_25395 [Xanthobacteraceae bacterium]